MAYSSSSSLRLSAPEFFPKTYTQNPNLPLLLSFSSSSSSSSSGEDGGNLPDSGVPWEKKVIVADKEEKGFSIRLSTSSPEFIPSKCLTTTPAPTPTLNLTPLLARLSMEQENLSSEFAATATDAKSQRPKSRSETDQKNRGEPPLGLCDTYPKNSCNQVTANIGSYNYQEKMDPIHFIRHEKHTEEAMEGGSSHQSEPYLDAAAPTGVGVPFASSLHSHNGKKEHSTYTGDKCLGMSEDVSSFTETGLGLEGEDDAEECFRSGRMKSSQVLLDSINFINQSGYQLVRSIHYLSQVLVHILSSKSSEASNNDDAMALQSTICALSYCLLKQTRRGFATDSDIKENLKTDDKPTNKNQSSTLLDNLPPSDHAIEGIEKEKLKLKSGFPADDLPPKIVEMGDFYERVVRLQHLLQTLEDVVSYELNESSAIVNLYQNLWRRAATAISSLSLEIQEAKKNLVVTKQSLRTLEMAGKENQMCEYVARETAAKTTDGFKEISLIGEIDNGSLFPPQGIEFDGCGGIQSTPITNVSKQANAYCKLADSASNFPKKDFNKGREYQCDDRRGSERRVVHHSKPGRLIMKESGKQKDGFANKKIVITTPCQDSSATKMSFTKEEPGIITKRNKSEEMDQSSALDKIIKNNSETNCVSFDEGYLATRASSTKKQPGIVTGRNKSEEVDIDQVLHGFQLHSCEAKNSCSSDLNPSDLWELEGLGDREIICLKTSKTHNQLVCVDGDSEWEHVVKWQV